MKYQTTMQFDIQESPICLRRYNISIRHNLKDLGVNEDKIFQEWLDQAKVHVGSSLIWYVMTNISKYTDLGILFLRIKIEYERSFNILEN